MFVPCAAPASGKQIFPKLTRNELVPLGTEKPIGTLILLERDRVEEPVLEDISKADMLAEMTSQNFVTEQPGIEILDRLISVVDNSQRRRLRYHRSEDAARCIVEAFGN